MRADDRAWILAQLRNAVAEIHAHQANPDYQTPPETMALLVQTVEACGANQLCGAMDDVLAHSNLLRVEFAGVFDPMPPDTRSGAWRQAVDAFRRLVGLPDLSASSSVDPHN